MGRPFTFNDEQELAIKRRYDTGEESVSAIAETLGVTRQNISGVLHRHGVKTRWHHHALTPEQEEEAVKRFVNGETGRDLAKYFGCDQKTITKLARDRKGPLRRCGRKRKFNSRKEWRENPSVRLRILLLNARAGAPERGLTFNEALFAICDDPPKTCACCGVTLDYAVRARSGDSGRDRSPSLDRCDNLVGYVAGNVYVTCYRCNRLKNDATATELIALAAYVTRHLERNR